MRDIVSSNGFSAPVPAKAKVAKTPSNAGSLARPEYRSYRDFLESYNDNKSSRDDQESVSSTDSGMSSYKLSESQSNNTSTSSLNSEVNGTSSKASSRAEDSGFGSRTGSFRNYLESYNYKKFSSVRPIIPPKKNLVKSEIVIHVNDPLENVKPDSFCVTTLNGDEPDFMSPPVDAEVPNFPPPPPPLDLEVHQVEEFQFSPPPPPPPPALPDFAKASSGKKWGNVKTEDDRPQPNSLEKLPPSHAAAANLAKILTQHLLPRRKALEAELNLLEEKPTNGAISAPQCSRNEENVISVVPPAPKLPNGFSYAPVAPKLPQPLAKKAQTNGVIIPCKSEAPKKPEYVTHKTVTVELAAPKLPQTAPPKVNGRSSPNDTVDFNTTTVVPVADGSAKVSKSDPNVRKLVYNTYRGLLGAYNNKANDMISTLPRNMVREDQGVSKQLESMALQGGLEKLNGRTNPNVEQE